MAAMKIFSPGDIVFTPDGRKAEFVAHNGSDECVVRLAYVHREEGCEEEYFDRITSFPRVFGEAPRAVYDEQVKLLDERAANLRHDIDGLYNEARIAKSSTENIIAKFKRYEALRDLEDYIDDKITHFVICDWSEISIREKDAALDQDPDQRYDKKQKLLTLFGDSKGNLQWMLNRYRDGSGSNWSECYPCLSLDEAREKARKIIDGIFAAHLLDGKWSQVDVALKTAAAFSFPIPAEIQAQADVRQIASLRSSEKYHFEIYDKARKARMQKTGEAA